MCVCLLCLGSTSTRTRHHFGFSLFVDRCPAVPSRELLLQHLIKKQEAFVFEMVSLYLVLLFSTCDNMDMVTGS